MSAKVGEMSAIFSSLGNLRVEIVIHKSAQITSEDTWNNM